MQKKAVCVWLVVCVVKVTILFCLCATSDKSQVQWYMYCRVFLSILFIAFVLKYVEIYQEKNWNLVKSYCTGTFRSVYEVPLKRNKVEFAWAVFDKWFFYIKFSQ